MCGQTTRRQRTPTYHPGPSVGAVTSPGRSFHPHLGKELTSQLYSWEGLGGGGSTGTKAMKLSSLPITRDKLTTPPTAQQA